MPLHLYLLIQALTTALSKCVAGERPVLYCTMLRILVQITKALINRNATGFLVMNTKSHYLVFFYYAYMCNFLSTQDRV